AVVGRDGAGDGTPGERRTGGPGGGGEHDVPLGGPPTASTIPCRRPLVTTLGTSRRRGLGPTAPGRRSPGTTRWAGACWEAGRLRRGRCPAHGGAIVATKYVYDFSEGNKDLKDLLGGKGANLAEMTRLGLPVPPGFTITPEACRAFLVTGEFPDGLVEEIDDHLKRVERAMGRRFGGPGEPLLLSVRSGARFSMPGMMETI